MTETQTQRPTTGTRVVALATRHRRFAVDFPGWDHPDYERYLLDIPAGLAGQIVEEEQHGMRPWTRYVVRFDDGTRACGLALGRDIQIAEATS